MHHQPCLMFKSNPFQQEFRTYQGKNIKTLPLKNFSFLNSTQTSDRSHRNQIHLKPHPNAHSILSQFQTIPTGKKPSHQLNPNFLLKNSQIKSRKPSAHNLPQKPKINFQTQTHNKNQPSFHCSKITETSKITDLKNMALTARQPKPNPHEDHRFCSLNISHGHNTDFTQLKQKLYQSIDFDNLFSKIQSQVTHCERSHSPQNSPKMRDKLMLLDKMKRYSKTPNSKARTVFDQFNLKYLINKRKNFNLKNQSNIKGSHLPYFQCFNSSQLKNFGRAYKPYEANTSLDKISARCPDLTGNQGEPKRKNSSFIVIDDHGIVHEQNSANKDRDKMMKKISGKLINMRQMLKIQKIDHKTSR